MTHDSPRSLHRRATAIPREWQRRVLAVAVGLLGLVNVLPELVRQLGLSFVPRAVLALAGDLSLGPIGSLPETAAGLVLILMSSGLISGSRFAWAMTVLMTLAVLLRRLIHQPALSPPVLVIGGLLLALLYLRRSFDRSSLAAETSFAVLSLLALLGFAVFGTYLLGADFSPHVDDLLTALYFSVATLSTVGYGDIIPKTDEARVFVMSVIVIGVSIFATSLSTVVIPLVNRRLRASRAGANAMKRTHHTIIIGDTPLARNAAMSLRARELAVTRIVAHELEHASTATDADDDVEDIVVGDPTDQRTLALAGIERAIALLALTDDDAENVFVLLAAREAGTKAKTTVSVRTEANIGRVRLANPDVIIAPDVFGGEMLAMSINGEAIEPSPLVQKIFNRRDSAT